MSYVITQACIDVKDGACVAACPVDCIYSGSRMLYIHPDECISCSLCESVCPVAAIHEDDRVPTELVLFIEVNREFFAVAGIGSPGGAGYVGAMTCDHPVVANAPPNPRP